MNWQHLITFTKLSKQAAFPRRQNLIIPPGHPMSTVETIRPQEFSLFKKDGFISFRNVQSGGSNVFTETEERIRARIQDMTGISERRISVFAISEIPRSSSGKIQYSVLINR